MRIIRYWCKAAVCLFVGAFIGGSYLPNVQARPTELIQFTANHHILGFAPGNVWIGSQDRMLRLELVGSRQVRPDTVGGSMDTHTGRAESSTGTTQRIRYTEAWEGVSVEYVVEPGVIAKSTYTVRAGQRGNPVSQICIRYNQPVSLDAAGNLIIRFSQGEMRESAPVAWQEKQGKRVPVPVRFRMMGPREVGFSATYDPAYALVIDPALSWNTFFKATGGNSNLALAFDSSGNIYICGSSLQTWGTPVRAHSGGSDFSVAKFNSNGVLQWCTFLGGTGTDLGYGIAVDGNYVYVCGESSATWGSPLRAYSGGKDIALAKLNNNGVLQWNTFLGSTSDDIGRSVVTRTGGSLFIGGESMATWGTPVRAFSGSSADAFVASVYSDGTLGWNTFLGATVTDITKAIATDVNDNCYVFGESMDSWGAPIRAFGDNRDVFVAKLSTVGVLQWNTFIGGDGYENAWTGAVDKVGNIYVAGNGNATWGSPVRPYAADLDAFAAKLNPNGLLQWNTFLGGAGYDYGQTLVVDGSGNLYLGGYSLDNWGTPLNAYSASPLGSPDAFMVRLSNNGALIWSTFLGAQAGMHYGWGMGVDNSNGEIYFSGDSTSTWGTPINPFGSGTNGFLAKYNPLTLNNAKAKSALVDSTLSLTSRGKNYAGMTDVKLKNTSLTIPGTGLSLAGVSKFVAQFALPATPGLYDLVLTRSGVDYVFKSVFTVLQSITAPVRWSMTDMGQAGNPTGLTSGNLTVADADRNGKAEVYVASNDSMLYKFYKPSSTAGWSIGFFPEQTGHHLNDVLVQDANEDGELEVFGASTQPSLYQYTAAGTGWSTTPFGTFSSPIAVGDGNANGLVDVYGVSITAAGNVSLVETLSNSVVATGLGTVFCMVSGDGNNDDQDEIFVANSERRVYQLRYNGAAWEKSIVAVSSAGDMKKLALGDVDSNGSWELYGANQDKRVYQYQWSGSSWTVTTVGVLPEACSSLAVGDGDSDGAAELYVACSNGHAYQIRYSTAGWVAPLDLGHAGSPLLSVAVGDGDHDFTSEVYALAENAHVVQYRATGVAPTPTITPTAVPTSVPLPDRFLKIYHSKINPNQGEQALIRWTQPQNANVTITVYNLVGDKICTLVDRQTYVAGRLHELPWKGQNTSGQTVGSGIYIVHIKTDGFETYSKVAVIK